MVFRNLRERFGISDTEYMVRMNKVCMISSWQGHQCILCQMLFQNAYFARCLSKLACKPKATKRKSMHAKEMYSYI